jgi:hypothetical protein
MSALWTWKTEVACITDKLYLSRGLYISFSLLLRVAWSL